MAPNPVNRSRWSGHTTPRRCIIAAFVLLVPVPFFAADLPRSIAEHRALQSGALCSELRPTCLVSEEVALSGPHDSRRGPDEWWATDGVGRTDTFGMTPTWGEAVPLSAGRGTVYRLDGRVVAASSGDDLVPTALSGSHAVTLDIFALIALLGFSSVFFLAVRRSRSAGARWSDEIAPLTQGWGFASAASFVGSVGALTTFTLGVGVVPWVVMGVVWGAVLLYAVHLRQMRRRRGVGGHAAW